MIQNTGRQRTWPLGGAVEGSAKGLRRGVSGSLHAECVQRQGPSADGGMDCDQAGDGRRADKYGLHQMIAWGPSGCSNSAVVSSIGAATPLAIWPIIRRAQITAGIPHQIEEGADNRVYGCGL